MSPYDLAKLQRALSGTEKLTPGQMLQAAILGEYESAPVEYLPCSMRDIVFVLIAGDKARQGARVRQCGKTFSVQRFDYQIPAR